jgi:thiol-disulfide isomerase/thioredoxin
MILNTNLMDLYALTLFSRIPILNDHLNRGLMKQHITRLGYCIGILVFVLNIFAQEQPLLKTGDPAPTFFLRTLEGENFFLSKEIKPDSPIVLAFYATWCIPCRQEIPALEKMMTDPSLKKVRLYYVNVGGLMAADEAGDVIKQREESDKVRRHKERFKMTHPILMDRYALTAQKFNAESLPTLLVIGGEGTIKYIHHGYKPGDEQNLSMILRDLLRTNYAEPTKNKP